MDHDPSPPRAPSPLWPRSRRTLGRANLIAVAAAVTFVGCTRHAGAADEPPAAPAPPGDRCVMFDHGHDAWSSVLRGYVRDGHVDYAGLKRSGEKALGAYLSLLQSVCRGHYATWTRDRKLAFWINAYNAHTVRLILDHYPLSSVREIGILPFAAFRTDFIEMEKLRGDTLSLNDIEHEILRGELKEPRIHFAIVCASKSCPALRSEAFRAGGLDEQLDDAARTFIRDPSKNRIDPASRTVQLSSIFDWFGGDFERAAGSVPAYVARYADEPAASVLRAEEVRAEFLDYDWSLNGK